MSDTERQIDDSIEQAANPLAGEQAEPAAPSSWSPPVPERSEAPAEPADEEKTTEFEPPTAEPAKEEEKDDGGADWRTWSGRSINP